jgi:hypothetical protein
MIDRFKMHRLANDSLNRELFVTLGERVARLDDVTLR